MNYFLLQHLGNLPFFFLPHMGILPMIWHQYWWPLTMDLILDEMGASKILTMLREDILVFLEEGV